MKRFLTIILSLVLCLSMGALLVACGETGTHEHTYETEWTSDDTYHWQKATCEHVDLVKDKAEHTYGSDGKCTVCQAEKAHEHTYETEWTSDETHHWYKATCEHSDQVKAKAEHSWDEGVINPQPTHTDAGVKTFTCTVCSKTKTESVDALGHTFGEFSKDGQKHWKECSCGVKSEEVHAFDANGACSCGWLKTNIDQNGWGSALLFENFNNFTYQAVHTGTTTYYNGDNIVLEFNENQQSEVKCAQDKGEDRVMMNESMAGKENYYDSFHQIWAIEQGMEYRYYPYDGEMWYKSSTELTSQATLQAEISVFKQTVNKYNVFSYDAENKWYVNSEPLEFSLTQVDIQDMTSYFTNCTFRFKVEDNKIVWMALTADRRDVTLNVNRDVYYGNDYQSGVYATKCVTETQMQLEYFDIGTTTVTVPSQNIILDPDMTDYWCEHDNLSEVKAVGTAHMQTCLDCNGIINWEMHVYIDDTHENTGVCLVCEYACLHGSYIPNYSAVDNDYHKTYCQECGKEVLFEHEYDASEHCAICNYTKCAHTNSHYQRINNEKHSFSCQDCWINSELDHNYVQNVCSDCNAVYCDHAGIDQVDYGYISRGHYKICPNDGCGDMLLLAEHILEGEECTICDYVVCHHPNIEWSVYEGTHNAWCDDCNEGVDEQHDLVDGVCSVCGYDQNCEHTNLKYVILDDYRHIQACADCGFISYESQSEEHDWSNSDGICSFCEYDCSHPYGNTVYDISDATGHYKTCAVCNKLYNEAHRARTGYDSTAHYAHCLDCDYQLEYEEHDLSNVDGTCSGCDYACGHWYDPDTGLCEFCGVPCQHAWSDYTAYEFNGTHRRDCSICHYWEENDCTPIDGYDFSTVTGCYQSCSVCKGKFNYLDHDVDSDNVCKNCGFDLKTLCGALGNHDWGYSPYNEILHYVVCNDCGIHHSDNSGRNSHNFVDGICADCGYNCLHNSPYFTYSRDGEQGKHTAKCGYCQEWIEQDCVPATNVHRHIDGHAYLCQHCSKIITVEQHDLDQYGICYTCNTSAYMRTCEHNSGVIYEECYSDAGSYHVVKCANSICNNAWISQGEHEFVYDAEQKKSICVCGAVCSHYYDGTTCTDKDGEVHTINCPTCGEHDEYHDNNSCTYDDETHSISCSWCNKQLIVDESHEYAYDESYGCEVCKCGKPKPE